MEDSREDSLLPLKYLFLSGRFILMALLLRKPLLLSPRLPLTLIPLIRVLQPPMMLTVLVAH